MVSEALQRIRKDLDLLKNPRIHGWSLSAMTKQIVITYRELLQEERACVRELIQKGLTLQVPPVAEWYKQHLPKRKDGQQLIAPPQDVLEFDVALELASRIPIPEAREVLFSLLRRKEVIKDRWTLSNVLTALGRLKAFDALPVFHKYAACVSEADGETSRIGVAAILALSELDLAQVFSYLPLSFKGDFQYRNDLDHPGIGYRNSDVLLAEILARYGEDVLQPIAQLVLQQDDAVQKFVRSVINVLLKNESLLQSMGKMVHEEYELEEREVPELLRKLKRAISAENRF